jgi:hypothetical protein
VQRTSDAIGTLATALAKAQRELINPEKTLEATIQSDRPGEGAQTFRYASLSSGLEIVRKTLGQHEIAIAQTTSIDQAAGIVNLTTVLAHSSGEWIASDWPVCPISDTATPHRMGKALTYARRYALFTLVGIAGEDDLNAPDLGAPTNRSPEIERPKGGNDRLNGAARHGAPEANGTRRRRPAEPPLTVEASAELRDQLAAQINGLKDGDEAAVWAKLRLPQKNRLTAADGQCVEETFNTRLTAFGAVTAAPLPRRKRATASHHRAAAGTAARGRSTTIDKSLLRFPEPRRVRDRDHLRFVAKHSCLICERKPSDPHHLRFTQNAALGRKVSDEFAVPLCRGHHREVHRAGDEAAWWAKMGIDPTVTARMLWLETHPLPSIVADMQKKPIASKATDDLA